ncbi:MAG: VCBS repeat-containing protein [Polyangiales bacterium]
MAMARGGWFWRVRGVRDGVTGNRPSATWWFWISEGSSSQRATVASSIADVNGDGLADLVVRSTRSTTTDGGIVSEIAVDIHLGRRGGPAQDADQRIAVAGSALRNVAVADVDGDGTSDILIGDPEFNRGAGRVVVHGGGAIPLGQLASIAAPDTSPRSFGTVVDAVGDLDGDGRPEIVVQSPGAMLAGATQSVHVFGGDRVTAGGAPTRTLVGTDADRFANVLGCDVNGDGRQDLIVAPVVALTAPSRRIEVWLGGERGLAAAPAQTVTDSAAFNSNFLAVCVGDRDGDGFNELAVADVASGNGRVLGYAGAPRGVLEPGVTLVEGAQSAAPDGYRVLAAPSADATGDGLADLVATWIGPAPNTAPPTRLLEAPALRLTDGFEFAGVAAGRAFEAAVVRTARGVGDVDGDGMLDYCFVRHDAGASFGGDLGVSLRFGSASGVDALRTWRVTATTRAYSYCAGM